MKDTDRFVSVSRKFGFILSIDIATRVEPA
jgi:hypothetical protein